MVSPPTEPKGTSHSQMTIASVFSFYAVEVGNVIRQPLFLSAVSIFLLWILFSDRGSSSRGFPLPPGPKPLPLIGNLHQVNTAQPWLTYTAWKKKYGDLLHVRLLGQTFIVLNSEKVARALLDQRSALYSDRPEVAAHTMFGLGFSTVMLPYGDEWRLHRKMFQHAFRAESEAHNREVYLKRVRTLLANLLDTPAEFEVHIKSYVASNVMALAYGHEMAVRDDPMVETVMNLVNIVSKALSPERSAVLSAFPFLEKLPGWLPGGDLWRDAPYVRKLVTQVLDVPFESVQELMRAGNAPPSMVADCLTQLDQNVDDYRKQEYAIKSAAATIFIAGFETSSSVLYTFILAMVLHPEVQAKAQAEIDSVVGEGRLPDFGDKASLPYVDAILSELMRWNPTLPLAIPHATSDDDVYEGYHIPKGAFVLINVWAMGQDEEKYDDVEAFKPERFLTDEGTLKDGLTLSTNPMFGFGRRICPGRFASEAFMWAAMVSILANFWITKAKDANGKEIDVKKQFTTGLSVRPVQFPCEFICRSDRRAQMIREIASDS